MRFIKDMVVDVAGIAREALVLALPGQGGVLRFLQGPVPTLRAGPQPGGMRLRPCRD